jgi:hypothetical protein
LIVCGVRIVELGADMCGGNIDSSAVLVVCDVRIVELVAGVRGWENWFLYVLMGYADRFVVCIGVSFSSTVVITGKLSMVLSWSINI